MGNSIPEGDMSIHIFELDEQLRIKKYVDQIPISERIRDIILDENQSKLFMVLENSPSIGILHKVN